MTTLVLTGEMADRLSELAALDIETGAVLLVRRAGDGTDQRLLGFEMHEVPKHAYERREAQQLLITSDGYVPALARAEETGCIPIWLHTHPGDGSCPESSRHDDIVDQQLSDLFRLRADSDYYGALIVSIDGSNLTFTGHLDDGDSRTEIDRLLVVGDRLAVHVHYKSQRDPIPELFDRHVRAFGGDVQRALGTLNVAVVGCGGTGSAVAEQLVRLGVRHLLLVDPDVLSASNVTRVYGSTAADVDRPKVDVLAEHLSRIAPDLQVNTMPSMLTAEATARAVSRADVVFGCTDDNAGRLVLSRLATYMSILVIDCGVILSSDGDGTLDGIHGRVTMLSPGSACLVCRNRIDTARAASELLTPEERGPTGRRGLRTRRWQASNLRLSPSRLLSLRQQSANSSSASPGTALNQCPQRSSSDSTIARSPPMSRHHVSAITATRRPRRSDSETPRRSWSRHGRPRAHPLVALAPAAVEDLAGLAPCRGRRRGPRSPAAVRRRHHRRSISPEVACLRLSMSSAPPGDAEPRRPSSTGLASRSPAATYHRTQHR